MKRLAPGLAGTAFLALLLAAPAFGAQTVPQIDQIDLIIENTGADLSVTPDLLATPATPTIDLAFYIGELAGETIMITTAEKNCVLQTALNLDLNHMTTGANFAHLQAAKQESHMAASAVDLTRIMAKTRLGTLLELETLAGASDNIHLVTAEHLPIMSAFHHVTTVHRTTEPLTLVI